MVSLARPAKRVFNFDYFDENRERLNICFNSVFDSGNLCLVEQVTATSYTLHTSPDFTEATFQSIFRSWFYFSVQGPPPGTIFTFTIKRINILYQLFRLAPETYKPVYRIGDGPWRRLEQPAKLIEDTTERSIDVQFDFMFGKASSDQQGNDPYDQKKEIFFAFSYPFSYKECQDMVNQFNETYANDPDIYFHHEVFTRSSHKRRINLLTISSHDEKLEEQEGFVHPSLFPNREQIPRAQKFSSNKPIVLFTARVHPGESPSSFAMKGILDLLLDKEDPRAKVLRQNFVFMIIPMLNPDGVYHGYYRLDVHGQNLNRHYRLPDYEKQPANYAVKKLVHHLHSENRLFFYSDLHSHASTKGCFFYGNALSTSMQTETFLFARLMELNHPSFQFDNCNFSRKHMNSRDRGEKLTKEGAGRVCVYRISNIPHSYTLECGFHFYYINPPVNNRYENTSLESIPSSPSKGQLVYFTNHTYEQVGKTLLISILDICDNNPYSQLPNTRFGSLQGLRADVISGYSKRDFEGSPLRARCPSLSGSPVKPPTSDAIKEIPLKKLPDVIPAEKKGISLSQNASTHLSYKRSKPFNTNLYAKIGELLTSMVLDRTKTLEPQSEPEPKTLKLKKLITPKKIKLKKLAFEPPVVSCPAPELMVSVDMDDKRKNRGTLPRLWESGVLEAQKSLMYESIQSEGPQGGFLVQPLSKEKEVRHRGRLLTYRGHNFTEVMNSVDTPKLNSEIVKKECLPPVGQSFIKQPKTLKKKNLLQPLIKAIVIKKSLAKRHELSEMRPPSKTNPEAVC